jgi:hypothetical protein
MLLGGIKRCQLAKVLLGGIRQLSHVWLMEQEGKVLPL